MHQLKDDTCYFQYIDDDTVYVSDVRPILRNDKSEHPKFGFKCVGSFYIKEFISLDNLIKI